MMKKLRARRGETLAEVLVAVLVTAASICLLTGMVNASMSINMKLRAVDGGTDGFYPSLSEAETHVFNHSDDDPITVKTTGGPSTIVFGDTYSHTQDGQGAFVVYGKEG